MQLFQLFYLITILAHEQVPPNFISELLEKKKAKFGTQALIEKIFYESFIPMECMVFLISTKNMNEGSIREFIKNTVLPAKSYILQNKDKIGIKEILKTFYTFETVELGDSKEIKGALDTRNLYFENDKSNIAKQLFLSFRKELDQKLTDSLEINSDLITTNTDEKYIKAILALRRVVLDYDNVNIAIEKERNAFMGEFEVKEFMSPVEILDLKMKLNLGGSIFAPNVLLQVFSQLIISKKEEFIKETVTIMLKPIEELRKFVKKKENVDIKVQTMRFLNACHKRSDWVHKNLLDEAFRERTFILENFLHGEKEDDIVKKERDLDLYQENYLVQLINKIGELDNDDFNNFIVFDQKILNGYIKFLKNGREEWKNELIKLFK